MYSTRRTRFSRLTRRLHTSTIRAAAHAIGSPGDGAYGPSCSWRWVARQGDGYCVVESAGEQLASNATHPPLSPSRFSWSEHGRVYRLVNALTLGAPLPSDDILDSPAWFTTLHCSSTHDYTSHDQVPNLLAYTSPTPPYYA
jgi:hypothetical protein